MSAANYPVSGLPLSERMRCHRIPTRCIPCQRVNWSTGQLTVHLSGQLANRSTDQLCMDGPSGPHHAPRINQPLPLELLKGESGEGAVIDEEDDDGSAGERVGERDEFRPALQGLR